MLSPFHTQILLQIVHPKRVMSNRVVRMDGKGGKLKENGILVVEMAPKGEMEERGLIGVVDTARLDCVVGFCAGELKCRLTPNREELLHPSLIIHRLSPSIHHFPFKHSLLPNNNAILIQFHLAMSSNLILLNGPSTQKYSLNFANVFFFFPYPHFPTFLSIFQCCPRRNWLHPGPMPGRPLPLPVQFRF
jgi:hypothetical protein